MSDTTEPTPGVEALFTPGGVHELRIPDAGRYRTISGYFDAPEKLAAAAIKHNSHGGVYFTLNPCNPALLARSCNTAAPYAKHTTSDDDIMSRRWLFIDLDPDRPTGIPSTDAEHEAALNRARQIADHLTERGWPEPVLMDSGNGAYLLYRIDEPNDAAALARINGCLKALAAQFNDIPIDGHTIKVDTTGGNASRIVRTPATTNRKGSGSPDRQHRPALILSTPTTLDVVDTTLLDALAGEAAEPEPSHNSSGPGLTEYFTGAFNLEAFIARHFPDAVGPKNQKGTEFWELPVCPFNPEHNRREAFIGRLSSGALTAGCHHDSCTWGWSDLRDHYEPRQAAPSSPRSSGEPGGAVNAEEAEPTTWEPHDLAPYLNGERVSPQPAVGISRSDGQKMIYPGKEHTVYGETEAGKSWIALESTAVEIRMGRDVLYIHYEEGDPGSTIERLLLLSVPAAEIAKHLRFVAPARPARGEWLAPLLAPPPVLVIHDGVNEAMSLQGDEIFGADGAATFRRTLIKPCLAAGAATLSCDHVTKSSEGRGRYAYGSGHKINAVDGAAFMVENVEPFGRGLRGVSNVFVTKDRPGQLRAHGKATGLPGKTFFGVLVVDASPEAEADFLTFFAPKDDDESPSEGVDARGELAEAIYRVLLDMPEHTVESGRQLFAAMRRGELKFKNTAAHEAIDDLLLVGRIEKVPGVNNSVGYRAVVSASHASNDAGASPSDSFRASPIGGEAREAPTNTSDSRFGKHWEAPGSTAAEEQADTDTENQSPVQCRHCSAEIPAHMHAQRARGHCSKASCGNAEKERRITEAGRANR